MNLISEGYYQYLGNLYKEINPAKNFIPNDYDVKVWINKRVLIDEEIFTMLDLLATSWTDNIFLIRIK